MKWSCTRFLHLRLLGQAAKAWARVEASGFEDSSNVWISDGFTGFAKLFLGCANANKIA